MSDSPRPVPSFSLPRMSGRFDLVIADIDGCLGPEGPAAMDVASLAKVAEHNHLAMERRDRPIVTVCSGRPQPFAEAMCKLIGNMVAPCIAENGVWMYHPGKNLYLMDPAITAEHKRVVREASEWLAEEFGPEGVEQQPGKSAAVSLYHSDTGYLRSIAPVVEAEFKRRGWPMRVSMTWLYINCDLEHVTKGTGVDRLLKSVGVPKERVAGIGDTTGDRPIRERVGWFACPANAQEEIKGEADYVAEGNEAVGVVEILSCLG
jgi:hydroxymethylpyrimidine pyrophosphatase-like HAD family hydrolase